MPVIAVAVPHLDTPLDVILGHMHLLAAKRLSEAGRQRLEVLEARIHLLATMLESNTMPGYGEPRRAAFDLGVVVHNVVWELDAVLEDEAPRPY